MEKAKNKRPMCPTCKRQLEQKEDWNSKNQGIFKSWFSELERARGKKNFFSILRGKEMALKYCSEPKVCLMEQSQIYHLNLRFD